MGNFEGLSRRPQDTFKVNLERSGCARQSHFKALTEERKEEGISDSISLSPIAPSLFIHFILVTSTSLQGFSSAVPFVLTLHHILYCSSLLHADWCPFSACYITLATFHLSQESLLSLSLYFCGLMYQCFIVSLSPPTQDTSLLIGRPAQ